MMENKCKRFLSLLLAFVMVLGMFPAGHVHAEEAKSYNVSVIDHNKITGLASSNREGETSTPEEAFDGVKNENGQNTNYWHSNVVDDVSSEYLIGILDGTYLIDHVVYYRRGAAYSGSTYNGRVTACEIYVTTDDVTAENATTVNWELAATAANMENATSNIIEFNVPKAAKAVKMVATANDGASGFVNKVFTCQELEIFQAVCPDGDHNYNGCLDAECDDCFAIREPLGHVDEGNDNVCDECEQTICTHANEVTVPAVDATWTSTGLTAGKKCADCDKTLEEQQIVPTLYNQGIVPKEAIKATTGSFQPNNSTEGAADLVLDEDFGTMWHTHWDGTAAENLWIDFELTDNYDVTGLRYKPRTPNGNGEANGLITKYQILGSYDGETYFEIKSDAWDFNDSWKVVEFNGIQVKHIRLKAVESYSTNSSRFASAVEIRLIGEATEHEHNFTGTVETLATLQGAGLMKYTCSGCDATYTVVIPQLTVKNAQPLMDNWNSGVVSLNDCLYTLSGTEGAYSLSHGGSYYVKPAANGNGIPQQNAPFAGLTLQIVDGKLRISAGASHLHVHLAGTAHTESGTHPWWNKCDRYHADAGNGSHDFYLLKANANSTFAGVPGYEVVTTLENAVGGSYLIAFTNKTGEWFVMYPSTETVSLAKVVTDAVTHTHDYTVETVTKDPTCAETGLKDLKCSCGHFHAEHKNVEIPVANHGTITHVAAKDATCTEAGIVEHWRCETCGETWSDEACTQVIEDVTIPAAHQIFHVSANEPTCTTQGNPEYWGCMACDKFWLDAELKVEASVDETILDINPNAHKWGEWQTVTAATCTTKGSEKCVCAYNDEHVETQDTEIDANAHTYGTLVEAQPLVHTQTELKASVAAHYKCACGKYFTEGYVETSLAALTGEIPEHDSNDTIKGKAPTCTEKGLTDGKKCSVCGKIMTAQTEIPAKDHSWNISGYTDNGENHTVNYVCANDGAHTKSGEPVAHDFTKGDCVCGAKAPVVTNVAMIGEQGYATLAAAIAAAQEGDTILLVEDVTEEIQISDNAVVDLDLNGKTLNGFFKPFKGNLTVKNGSIVNTNSAYSAIEINAGELVLNNVNVISARHAVRIDGAVTATIDGGEYKLNATTRSTLHALNVSGAAVVTIKAGTFVGPKGTAVDSGSAVNARAGAEVIIEGGSFSGGKLNTLGGAGTITVSGGTFDQNPTARLAEGYCAKAENGVYIVQAHNYKAAVTAPTCEDDGYTTYTCEFCGHNYKDDVVPALGHTFEREGGAWTEICGDCGAPNENFVEVTYVAQIGEQGYETLTAAIAAAKAGDTITFLADITEDVTISKSVTIDGADKTFTGQMKLTNKANVTIKNVNFDGNGYNGYAIETRGAYYVTIDGCTAKNYYGFVQLASATDLTTVKNVTVSGMNYGVKIDYSNAVILENVDITASVAAVLNSNYGAKPITIKNSALNILGTWTRNNTIKTTYTFEGANSIDEFITDAAIDNFKLAAGATLTAPQDITVTTDVENHEVVYENGTYKLAEKKVAVAMIGEQGYETLADAIAAAKAGDTITFVADITENVTINKSVTIDGADKTYTGQMKLTNKANVTIKNVNFDGKGFNGYAVEPRGASYITIEDCTAMNYGYGFVQVVSGNVLTTVKNVTVSNMNYGIKIDRANAVVLENVDITANVAAVMNSNYGTKTITIKDSKLSILRTWARNDTTQTTYVFEGANSIDEFITDAAIDNFKLAAGATLTAPQDITVTTDVENHEVVYENGTYKVVEKKVAVAMIGEQGYETLAAAIAAAKAGNTITFVADITENVTISKSVTIDGAGKTYTGQMKLTNKANVTIKNVNFDGKGFNGYAVEPRGASYITIEDCTAMNYGYGFVQVVSGNVLTTVKNVTVSNMNYGIKIDRANAVVLENVDITANVAAVMNSNYGTKTITIKDSKLSILRTWARNDTTQTTYVFEGANSIDQFVINANLDNFKLVVGATLTAPEGLNVTTNAGDGYKVIYEQGVYKVVHAPAAMIGTKGYATLGEAFADAQDGDTIVVMKNIDLAKETPVLLDGSYNTYFKVEGKNVTIDMNGMTISGAYTDSGKMLVGVFSTDNGGHLTVTGNGTVNVTATAKVYSLFANYEPGCSITIEDGSYTLDVAHDSLLYSGCNTAENEGITVNGGTFILGNVGEGTNGKPWIINCLGGNDNATVVNGGTFNSDISHQFWANEVSIPADLALKNNGDGTWTFVEAVACAEEKAASTGATVRKVGYATLQEAIDAAGNGMTVTLLKDIELGAADVKAVPGNLTAMINVAGKSLTLDMNGKTITAAYDASELLYTVIYVGDGASLTVKGDGKIDLITGDTKAGKYDCVAYMFLKSGDTGALNIENGTFTANKVEDSMVYTNGDKVVNIKGGNWTLGNVGTKTNGAPWFFNTKGQNERTILVSGGTYNFNVAKQYYACEVSIVDANGNLSYVVDNKDGTWTVTGQTAEVGIVTPTWRTNYLLGYATFKDAVASIAKGAPETTIVLQKDITVKGQFIGHSYAQKVVIDLNGYTMSSTDKTLTVYRTGTEVVINNGTVHGNTTGGTIQVTYGGKLTLGENVTITCGGSANAIKVDKNSTLIVNQDTAYVLGGKNDLVVANGATVQISAGYFKKPVQQAWCAEGYVPTDKLENGYYSVMKDPSIGMEAKIGDTYFESLQAAIEAAQDGDVIVVVNDITVDTTAAVMNSGEYAAIYNVAEKAITIDLNGKKIEVTANAADLESYKSGILLGVFCVDNNGELTLTGNGTVTANAVDASLTSDDSHLYSLMVAYGAGSKLTVENGTFHANSVSSALVYSQYDEIVTINGGTYTLGNLGTDSNGSPWLFNAKGQNERNILVNGGTFSADIQHQYYPFEVQMVKELALSKGEDGMYTVVPAVAYVNEQEWSSAWYTNYVGYATVEEAEAAVEPIKTKVIGKITYTSQQEYVTLITGDGSDALN